MNFSINVLDIQKKQYERDSRRREIYNKILDKCFYKIQSTVYNEYEHCFFRVPEYVLGSPIYNLTKCVIYLLQKLRENGFKCKYCHPYMIYISWKHKNNVLLIENLYADEKKESTKPTKVDYRPIDNSSDLDYLLYRKK